MKLKTLFNNLLDIKSQDAEQEIQSICSDSRQLKAGSLFLALPGEKHQGIDYVSQAIEIGASAIVCDACFAPIPERIQVMAESNKIPIYVIPSLSTMLGTIAARFYHHPSQKLHIVGVTGTNGKSSITYFIASALTYLGQKCGLLGTLGNGYVDCLTSSSHTTLDPISLQAMLARFIKDKVPSVAMEVSSHGLAQGRITACEIRTAIFTNLTHEHLDYHGTMENYGQAKKQLFLMPSVRDVIFNIDDNFGAQLYAQFKDSKNCFVLTTKEDTNCDEKSHKIMATEIQLTPQGLIFQIVMREGVMSIHSPLLGRFNVYNLLSVAAFLTLSGFPMDSIKSALESLTGVPGRMQLVQSPHPNRPTVLIDYAHTPDALKNALLAILEHRFGAVWCLFGCGGDRDRGKRPVMAAIAEAYADHIIVTSDNPRSESAAAIRDEIYKGFTDLSKVRDILNRRDAIEYALSHAKAKDVVLIAGKGHETYQEIQGVKHPFSDHVVVVDYWHRVGEPS